MNGMKPKFIRGDVTPDYYTTPNPYKNAPSCNVNLLEMSRYARWTGKKLVELTEAEVKMFKI